MLVNKECVPRREVCAETPYGPDLWILTFDQSAKGAGQKIVPGGALQIRGYKWSHRGYWHFRRCWGKKLVARWLVSKTVTLLRHGNQQWSRWSWKPRVTSYRDSEDVLTLIRLRHLFLSTLGPIRDSCLPPSTRPNWSLVADGLRFSQTWWRLPGSGLGWWRPAWGWKAAG